MFVAALRRLAEHCEFNNGQNDTVRDRLVRGLRSEVIQKHLLTERALTLDKAIEISVSMELATKEANHFSESGKLHKVFRDEKGAQGKCYRCDRTGHLADECWSKDVDCRKCGNKCKSKRMNKTPRQDTKRIKAQISKEPVFNVQSSSTTAEPNSSSDEAEAGVLSVKGGSGGYWETPLLEGRPVCMETDTGAAVSLVSHAVYKETLQHLSLRATSLKLKTYTGESVPTKGVINVTVHVNGQTAKLPLYLKVEGNLTSLMGHSWLEELRLDWPTIHMLSES